jgi:hypothetical protein
MYAKPFRIKRRENSPLDYGPTLNSEIALRAGGPLDGSGPGDITKWMAVPWQTDTSSCLSGYIPIMGQYVPTFWPVRVPNDVLSEEDYQVMMDTEASPFDRNNAFSNRLKWLRGIVYNSGYPPVRVTPSTKGINAFITEWPNTGILIQSPGPADGMFPDKIWVEKGRSISDGQAEASAKLTSSAVSAVQPDPEDGYLWMTDRAAKRRKG